MFKATLTKSIYGELGRAYSAPTIVEAGSRVGIMDTALAEATSVAICALDVSQLKLLAMLSTKDIVVKVNSDLTPSNTFTLLANQPFIWALPDGALLDTGDDSVSVDFVSLHLVNDGLVDAVFQLDAYFDPTV